MAGDSPYGPLLVLIQLLVCTGSLVVNRGPILRAKQAADWYAEVPVRLVASSAPSRYRVPGWVWSGYLLALLVQVTAVIVGIVRWPMLPDPFPIHFDGSGRPDAYAAKSVPAVFGVTLVELTILVLLGILSIVVARQAVQRPASGVDGDALRELTVGILAGAALFTSALIAALQLSVLLGRGQGLGSGVRVFMLVATVAFVLAALGLCFRVAVRREGGPAYDAPHTDKYWKGGIFYVNPDDPAVFVPKRLGVGFTVNVGSTGGTVLVVVIALVVVTSIALPMMAS